MSQELLSGTSFASFTTGGATARGKAMKLSGNTVINTTVITDLVTGIAMEDAANGAQVSLACLSGQIVTAQAGAAITAGAEVMPQASGDGLLVTAAGATSVSCGQALTAAAGSGSFFTMIFRPGVRSPANS
jgi:hypothetical protein